MTTLEEKISGLPTIIIGNRTYIPYQAVTDTVAAFLFPNHVDEMDEDTYVAIVETRFHMFFNGVYPRGSATS